MATHTVDDSFFDLLWRWSGHFFLWPVESAIWALGTGRDREWMGEMYKDDWEPVKKWLFK